MSPFDLAAMVVVPAEVGVIADVRHGQQQLLEWHARLRSERLAEDLRMLLFRRAAMLGRERTP